MAERSRQGPRRENRRHRPLIRYLALGDSYTIGEAVAVTDAWPSRLADALIDRGVEIAVEVIARTGWTAGELLAAVEAAGPTGVRDLVSLQVGVNDQYRGLPVAGYAADLASLLERAIGFTAGRPERVLVVSIPDWSATRHAPERDRDNQAREIDIFNDVCRRSAASTGCAWADVTASSRRAGTDPELIAEDGLHPSAKMYAAWIEEILPVVEMMLGV